jgi:plastocyanin
LTDSKNKNSSNRAVLFLTAAAAVSMAAMGFMVFAQDDEAAAVQTPAHKEFTLVAEEVELEVSPGQRVKAWTFNGTMPGPVLRFTEGDDVTIHFVNKTPMAHTVHFHGNHDDESDGVLPQVLPGETYTYNFVADPAGAMMYHCHAYPTSLHIRMGMYGAMIIDPKEPALKPAREFSLVLSEFDPENQENFVAKYYPVNGYTDQYMGENSLHVKQNELARFYVVNMGTTIPYSFHLHSTIFKVYPSGLLSNEPFDAQTIEIGPGNAAIVEATWKWPGTYLFHSHGLQEERGNMGEIVVEPSEEMLQETVSMIDWQYETQKRLQQPKAIEYDGLGGQADIAHTGHLAQSLENIDGKPLVRITDGSWDNKQKESYSPKEITVAAGSEIRWINEDSVVHTVTSKEGIFDSSLIGKGKSWTQKFDIAGTAEYYCALHPWMEGRVIVTE